LFFFPFFSFFFFGKLFFKTRHGKTYYSRFFLAPKKEINI
jgi:hypothetical protein